MKKIIGIFVMVFIVAFAAAPVLAISTDEESHGDKTIFEPKNVMVASAGIIYIRKKHTRES